MTNDNYFLIKGTPEEWIKNSVCVELQDKAQPIVSVRTTGVEGVYLASVNTTSLTDPALTKPKIRVPVWGQEFVVQGVKMEKGVICVDVTPPLIRDQYGNALKVKEWANDVIKVETPPKLDGIMPVAFISETQAAILVKENERLKKELEDMTKKMAEFRENYRKEHERANKLQDSEAQAVQERKIKAEELGLVREENKTLAANLKEAKEGWEEFVIKYKTLERKLENIKAALNQLST